MSANLPPFFISQKETNMPQTSVKMMQTETIEVFQLSERNTFNQHGYPSQRAQKLRK